MKPVFTNRAPTLRNYGSGAGIININRQCASGGEVFGIVEAQVIGAGAGGSRAQAAALEERGHSCRRRRSGSQRLRAWRCMSDAGILAAGDTGPPKDCLAGSSLLWR